MQHELLLGNARWDIIACVSKGKSSATEIANTTKSSLPNISQQLKLLEAYGIVEFVKEQRKSVGRKQQIYRLKQDLCHVTFARNGMADKRFFVPDTYHAMLLNILFVPNLQDHAYLHKYLLNDELLEHCTIAYVKGEIDIEVLLVTDALDLIRAKYSHTVVEHMGKKRKIIAWTHSVQEINDGHKDNHFESLLRSPIVLHDPHRQFDKIKRSR
jgi:DNA-binding HxlR family transcriptional regulator